jgi:soluble lytic murein transglycosylase-like protein
VTAALWAICGSAQAQVIEVQPDGAARVYAGPVVTSMEGSRPVIEPEAPVQPSSRRADTAQVMSAIHEVSERRQLSSQLIEAVAWQESRLNQNAVSPKGARGVMQLMPSTAQRLGVDAHDLRGNIDGGGAYLAQLLKQFDGDLTLALAAYNAGPDAVRRYGGVPPYRETQAYVAAVLGRLAHKKSQDPSDAVLASPDLVTR